MTSPKGFYAFATEFAEQFDRDAREIQPHTRLHDELAFDSFETLLLTLWLEERSGFTAPLLEIPPLITVNDAFGYFTELRQQAAAERSDLRGV